MRKIIKNKKPQLTAEELKQQFELVKKKYTKDFKIKT